MGRPLFWQSVSDVLNEYIHLTCPGKQRHIGRVILRDLLSGSLYHKFTVVAVGVLGLIVLLGVVGVVQAQQFVEAQEREQVETLDEDDEQPDPDNERVRRYRAARDAALKALGSEVEPGGGGNVLQYVPDEIFREGQGRGTVNTHADQHANASLSPEMALRIEKAFGVNMDMLLRMQAWHDASRMRARESEVSVQRYQPA